MSVSLRRTFGAAAGSAVLLLSAVTAAVPVSAETGYPRWSSLDAELLVLVNQARTSAGLVPLEPVNSLAESAYSWSETMASSRLFRHDTSAWATAVGCGHSYWAENIAFAGYGSDAADIFNLYWNSPPHHATMLNPHLRYAGFGTVSASWDYDGDTIRTKWNTQRFIGDCAVLDNEPAPVPNPQPDPAPLPVPDPVPEPVPVPDPVPAPDPVPVPDPAPAPDPDPVVPGPSPEPAPTGAAVSRVNGWSTVPIRITAGRTIKDVVTIQRAGDPGRRVLVQQRTCGRTGCGSWRTYRVLTLPDAGSVKKAVTYTARKGRQQVRVNIVGADGAVTKPKTVIGY